jgi:uncharacterized protein (DUF488 family)
MARRIRLFTIGFTRKSAREFFLGLKEAGVRKVLDIRLRNVSQLAGFAKKDDLAFFLRELCQCDYEHLPLLAPSKEILEGYRQKKIHWPEYEKRFKQLMRERKIEDFLTRDHLDHACLLCSEPTADKCHRRLVAEYLRRKLGNVEIVHL